MKIVIVGTVARVCAEQTFKSGFRKREVWIDEGGDEERTLPVEFTAGAGGHDGIAQTDALEPGQTVRVEATLQGRRWQDRCYLSLRGRKVDALGSEQLPLPGLEAPAAEPRGPAPAVPPPPGSANLDDLPF